MGLSPMPTEQWIETDDDIGRYHRHKLRQRALHGEAVYRALPESVDAQRELRDLLRDFLLRDTGGVYRQRGGDMHCLPGEFATPLDSDEPLWTSSLWVADDFVLMQALRGSYRLTAASLCCPSSWSLAEKFGCSLREIHDPIPGLHRVLTPRIDRFFEHLRPQHPVVRYNWSLQAHDRLADPPGTVHRVAEDTALYYRTERQSLLRLAKSRAVVFGIRVYLHPLQQLSQFRGALAALFEAIDAMSPALARYKGLDRLATAFRKYRALV